MIEHRLEFHRNALAVFPQADDNDPGVAVWLRKKGQKQILTCNCRTASTGRTCRHLRSVAEAGKGLLKIEDGEFFDADFRKSRWYRLAAALHDECPVSQNALSIKDNDGSGGRVIRIASLEDEVLVEYFADSRVPPEAGITEGELFTQRCGFKTAEKDDFHRDRVRTMLSRLCMTDSELVMAKRGVQTRRQALEKSFWYKLAYHCYRVMDKNRETFCAEIDSDSGRPVFICNLGSHMLVKITVPKAGGYSVLQLIAGDLENRDKFRVLQGAMQSIVKIRAGKDNGLILELKFLLRMPDGQTEIIDRKKLSPFWYGDKVYLPDKSVFASVQKPDRLWDMFGGKYIRRIGKEKVPQILDKLGESLFAPPNIIDESVKHLKVYTRCSALEIEPEAVERDWCWLSIRYGFGKDSCISLAEIYSAKNTGRRYLPVSDGWVDLRSLDMDIVTGIPGSRILDGLVQKKNRFRFSGLDLLRLKSAVDGHVKITGNDKTGVEFVSSVLSMRPPEPLPDLKGFSSVLRPYQKLGVEWLMFLSENRFGGLLCDDMGLGKTHQVMALMVWLLEHRKKTAPFLVVCPTTVISHWERKIREFAPGLNPVVYHGTERNLDGADMPGNVLITSYGILLRDVKLLSDIRFCLAAFDEAHFIKNSKAKSFAAASAVRAGMKLVVTGTPIENRITDLKALMDLVLPGYLGSDDQFAFRYMTEGKSRISELSRLVAPFTLRRTKEAVLTQLPEKIEDIMLCRLSDIQVKMYREAVDSRRDKLREALSGKDKNIPYIHIFALLTLLKQICAHPAIIDPEKTKKYSQALDSGKWEMFKELMDSCLESGRKIVVYSQFVGMVNMIVEYLTKMKVSVVSLTGASRNRGRIIDRFNEDPDCRVFVGSIRAGGIGIDLTAASVVIHYDRWWNASKEDQATDRVHRIGQTRGVQVYKLVTEGTLEEKISAIIARKKRLMKDVVAEDSPAVLKCFSPDELLELIQPPE